MIPIDSIVEKFSVIHCELSNSSKNNNNANDSVITTSELAQSNDIKILSELQASLMLQSENRKNFRNFKEKTKSDVSPIEELLGGKFNGK